MNTVLIKLGTALGPSTRPMLHCLLGLATTLAAAAARRSEVMPGAVKLVKALRHTVVVRLLQVGFACFA